jgi:hypothetical protein
MQSHHRPFLPENHQYYFLLNLLHRRRRPEHLLGRYCLTFHHYFLEMGLQRGYYLNHLLHQNELARHHLNHLNHQHHSLLGQMTRQIHHQWMLLLKRQSLILYFHLLRQQRQPQRHQHQQ